MCSCLDVCLSTGGAVVPGAAAPRLPSRRPAWALPRRVPLVSHTRIKQYGSGRARHPAARVLSAPGVWRHGRAAGTDSGRGPGAAARAARAVLGWGRSGQGVGGVRVNRDVFE